MFLPFFQWISDNGEIRRDYGTDGNNETDEKPHEYQSFRLFGYFRLFRNLSWLRHYRISVSSFQPECVALARFHADDFTIRAQLENDDLANRAAVVLVLTNNLPAFGNVNVIREDTKNKDLLFVGTELGLYVSLNGGQEWKRFMTGLPMVRVDDILIVSIEADNWPIVQRARDALQLSRPLTRPATMAGCATLTSQTQTALAPPQSPRVGCRLSKS